jgi:phosphatidylglycerophosphate synthase
LSVDDQQRTGASLKREFTRIGWLGVVGLAGGSILLGLSWRWQGALQWLAMAGLIWAFICYQTKRRLPLNRPNPEAPLYRELGWANRLTLLRAWLIAAVAGFLFQPWPEGPALAWMPGMLYFFAAMLDRVDGYVARRAGQSSLLGNELDTVSDALGLAVASLLAFGTARCIGVTCCWALPTICFTQGYFGATCAVYWFIHCRRHCIGALGRVFRWASWWWRSGPFFIHR